MLFRVFIVTLLTFGGGFTSSNVLANDATQPTLHVGFMNAIKRTDDGQYAGAIPDIMRELGNELQLNFTLRPMPIKHLLSRLESGQLDAVIGLFQRPEREKYATYLPTPVGQVSTSIFSLADSNITIDDKQLLTGYRVGMLNGAALGEAMTLSIANGGVKPVLATRYDILAKMFASKRVDVVVSATAGFESAMKRIAPKIQYTSQTYRHAPSSYLYLLLSKKSRTVNMYNLEAKLTQALNDMEAKGAIEKMYNRHGHTYRSNKKQFKERK